MLMFFELHDEKIIGYKPLSQADLGTGDSSHQTHIGLSEFVLTYLPNKNIVSEESIFIYEDKFEYIDAYFDRIKNKDGSFRSPKIRIGDKNCISIVSTIRSLVKSHDEDTLWYLLWFGLKNEKLVFFLFNNKSDDYNKISNFGLLFPTRGTKALKNSDIIFNKVMLYIENKINKNGTDILKELEISTQTQAIEPDKKFRKYDIDRANERNKQVGRNGEKLINDYLYQKLKSKEILSYTWCNEDKESGLPYDFSIQDTINNVFYFDVKSTDYDFNQRIIFSSQEMKFIATTDNNYCIYRVYKNINGKYSLRICDNCKQLSLKINKETTTYSNNLLQLEVLFSGAKLAISPNLKSLEFKSEICIGGL